MQQPTQQQQVRESRSKDSSLRHPLLHGTVATESMNKFESLNAAIDAHNSMNNSLSRDSLTQRV